jgi:broad specificity phosphatase PhoE
MTIALIPCACTEWQTEGRLLGRVELTPTADGEAQCLHWIEQLKALGLKQIHHGPDELCTRTAELLARKLLVPTKAVRNLAEVDVGLWAGLTDAELESRYASAHHELCDAPLNVTPPQGEDLAEADARLKGFLKKELKRNGQAALGLVLRPVSFALARCALEHRDPSKLWETVRSVREPVIIEVPSGPAKADQVDAARPS